MSQLHEQVLIELIQHAQRIIGDVTHIVNDYVHISFMNQNGTVHRVVGRQLDIMLDNGTFIQTLASSVTETLYNEESKQFPLKECSNHSPVDELPTNKYPYQLSLFQ